MIHQSQDIVPLRALSEASAFHAHTPPEGTTTWHSWADHATSVGGLAAEFGAPFGAESLCRLIGLTHDAGKLTAEVQQALRLRAVDHGRRLGAPHKLEGAALAGLLLEAGNKGAAHAMALANFGHHGGIPDHRGGPIPEVMRFMDKNAHHLDELVALIEAETDIDVRSMARAVTVPEWLDMRSLELFTRLCHSTLVDADFLDTEAHFKALGGPWRGHQYGAERLRATFDATYQREFGTPRSGSPSDLNALRWTCYTEAKRIGAQPPTRPGAIYRLPAPTGCGKTMSAAAFALTHAAEFDKRRVIVAVPFTSITTQNAEVYRRMFRDLGDGVVVEHHSNILNEEVADSGWRRLAASNWDAEFIVTTTVQLLESLFSNRPSATRKLHRLVNSVVVIDEVQSLPIDLLPAILRMLKELSTHYGVTVLLASATQPAFWSLDEWKDVEMVDLMPVHEVPAITQRVTYDVRTETQEWDEIADEVGNESQALVIVNTTSDAQRLHARIASSVGPDRTVRHLSTRMTNGHRARVLAEATALLRAREPITLVSTQLIEAGVDIDFPVVYRALAPADSVVQSAGRCNREGKLGAEGGRVVVFQPSDGGVPPGAYARATTATRSLFIDQANRANQEGREPLQFGDPRSMEEYYQRLYNERLGNSVRTKGVEINEFRDQLAYETTREAFRLIDDSSIAVVVSDQADPSATLDTLIDNLREPGSFPSRADRRLLNGVTASAPARLLRSQPHLFEQLEAGVVLWTGKYDAQVGLVMDGGGEASIW